MPSWTGSGGSELPGTTGRGSRRLERRGDVPRDPPTRDHRPLLRPPRIHRLLRDRRAGRGGRRAPRVPRRAGRADLALPADARPHGGRRRPRVSSTIRCPVQIPRATRSGWRSRSARRSVDASARGRRAGTTWTSVSASRIGHATLGTIGSDGLFRYAAIGTVTNLRFATLDVALGHQILISARVRAAVERSNPVRAGWAPRLKGSRAPGTRVQRPRFRRLTHRQRARLATCAGSSTRVRPRLSATVPRRSSSRRTRLTVDRDVPASSASASCVSGISPPASPSRRRRGRAAAAGSAGPPGTYSASSSRSFNIRDLADEEREQHVVDRRVVGPQSVEVVLVDGERLGRPRARPPSPSGADRAPTSAISPKLSPGPRTATVTVSPSGVMIRIANRPLRSAGASRRGRRGGRRPRSERTGAGERSTSAAGRRRARNALEQTPLHPPIVRRRPRRLQRRR